MKEYIIPLNDTAEDWDEMFVAVIRKQEELIRCKDCIHYVNTRMKKCGGKIPVYRCDITDNLMSKMDFCSWAERKEE